jgi:hypothetical protein
VSRFSKMDSRPPRKALRAIVPVPTSPGAWLREIAAAYADAHEAIPFGPLVGKTLTESELFHLAPSVCLKFRDIAPSEKTLKRATEAALASYVVVSGHDPKSLSSPRMAFAFCYLAAHFGLDLATENVISETMDFVAGHEKQLSRRIDALVGER